jgi:peptidoglycan/LPS O-acetylase OafA/YrhL
MQTQSESANLDVLRAVAVLIVLAAHLLYALLRDSHVITVFRGLGPFGVYLFFVHTSLVLMMSMERLRLSGKALFAGFYIRRVFRIYPLSIVCVVVVWMLEIPWVPFLAAYDFPTGPLHLTSNLLLTMNLTYSPPILAPLWSLPYELQMYLFLPLFFLFLRRCPSLAALIGIWALAVLLALGQPHVAGRIGDRLTLIQYAPCFISGIITFHLGGRVTPRLPFYLFPACVGALFLGFDFLDGRLRGWIPCLLLGLVLPLFREVETAWLRRGAHAVAKYSYGIYLFHMIAIWLSFFRVEASHLVRWALFSALMVVVPFVVYHALERPFVSLGQRLATRVVDALVRSALGRPAAHAPRLTAQGRPPAQAPPVRPRPVPAMLIVEGAGVEVAATKAAAEVRSAGRPGRSSRSASAPGLPRSRSPAC